MTISKTATELAKLLNAKLVGTATTNITGMASLQDAKTGDISFLGNKKYTDLVLTSQATIVIVPQNYNQPPPDGRAWLITPNPSAAFSEVIAIFAPPAPQFPAGIHPTAVVHSTAKIDNSVFVGACAVIEKGATVGKNSIIGAGVFIGEHTTIGENCHIHPNVTIRERSKLANRIIIHSGSTIGGDGFGYITTAKGHQKIPQVGIVQIEDDVEIGALTAVDRARFGRTLIKRGTKIDNLVQVAHNVIVGEDCLMVSQTGLAGSSELGNRVIIAGHSGVVGHVKVGDDVIITAKTAVTKDIPSGRKELAGNPAVSKKEYVRRKMHIKQIPKLKASIKELKQELAELKAMLKNKQ